MIERKEHWNIKKGIWKTVSFFLIFKVVSVVFGENTYTLAPMNDEELQQLTTRVSTTPMTFLNLSKIYEEYRIESEYCNQKSNCSESMYQTFPDKLCHCDKLCGLLNDCCGNYDYTSIPPLTKDQFECVSLYEIVKNRDNGVTMVTYCSSKWKHNATKTLCEGEGDESNIVLKLPVSDKTYFHVMFKNMYCAQCNFVNDFLYWKQDLKCWNETCVRCLPEMLNCSLSFTRPQPEISYRTCSFSQPVISSCNRSLGMSIGILETSCTEGVYSVTYDRSGKIYRNKYCALCNGVVEESMYCEQFSMKSNDSTHVGEKIYRLSLLVDVNTDIASHNGQEYSVLKCKSNEIYDILSEKCREIFCAPHFIATNGVCKSSKSVHAIAFERDDDSIFPENCTLTKLNSSEFKFTNNSEVYLFSHQSIYPKERFHVDGFDVFICLNKTITCLDNCETINTLFRSYVVEGHLTLVGLVVSILSLAITLLVYISFPQLLNIPGKNLVSLIISLMFAETLFLAAFKFEHIPTLCITVGVLVHYFFLAAFFWMNVIAFDLCMTFSNSFWTHGSRSKGMKRFVLYSLYAWLLPVVIVCTAIALDFIDVDAQFEGLKPDYGKGVCWLSSRNSLLLFFAGPLAVCKTFDIIAFISTAVHIVRARSQSALATTNKNTCSFLINVKLSVIMGLTWVFAFVANATNETSMWYLFTIFNSLQGLFIALCFLCTKKVGRLMRDKYQQITSRYAKSTQNTSVM